MNNFHFNPNNNRSVNLMKEYEQATRQLEYKKRELERKNLQIQFYEDPDFVKNKNVPVPQQQVFSNPSANPPQSKKYQNLADEIMNDLMSENKSNKINSRPETANYAYEQAPQMYQNMNNFNPNNNNLQNQANNYRNPSNQKQTPFAPRQNNFIQQNRRELEKQKLQNPSLNQENPFAPRSQPIKRSVEAKEQKPIINERQQQKLKLQQGQSENPFWGENRNNRSRQRNVNNQVNYQQYENVRQKQIQKLQKQLHNNNDFDLYQRPTSPPAQIPAQKDIQGQNISKKAAFDNRHSNPFVKDEEYLRQQKEQQQRRYRMELEEQKKVDEERKRNEKQKVKEEKYAFNAYEPGAGKGDGREMNRDNQAPIKSPALAISKKVDPNGKPPAYDYKQIQKKGVSQSDMQFMRIKANELRESFKKGRILHDEYTTQVKKLAEYYKVDYREVIDRKALGQGEEELPWIKDKREGEVRQDERRNVSSLPDNAQVRADNHNLKYQVAQKYQIVQNEQSLQRFPDSETSLKHQDFMKQPSSPSKNAFSEPFASNIPQQPYYPQFIPNMMPNPNPNFYTQNLSINPMQYPLASTSWMQQMPTGDVDLMRKIFEEVKAMKNNFEKNIEKQKTQKMILQQTFVKFMAQNLIHTPNLHQNPFQIQNQNLSQQYSQPNPQNYSPKPNPKQKNPSEALQLNFSEQSEEYIDKSLSGIINKIPFNNQSANRSNSLNTDPSFLGNTPQENFNKKHNKNTPELFQNQETIEQFFSKAYKQKKFKKFSIMVDVSQSSMEIPSVSNFLALKNGKEVVNKLFEEDLMTMKRLQREKEVEKLRSRVENQLSYGASSVQSSSTHQQLQAISQKVSYGKAPQFTNYAQTFSKQSQQLIEQNWNSGGKNSHSRQKELVTSQSKYEEYENYSRERESRSGHQQNHRTYKKEKEEVAGGFLKRHVSGKEENLPDFADQSDIKVRSPVYYSPKLNSQILEQDEYQTAQKSNQQSLQSEFYGDSGVRRAVSPQAKESTSKKYQMKKKDFAYEEVRESEKKSRSKSPRIGKSKSPQATKNKSKQPQPQSTSQEKPGIMQMLKQNNQALHKYAVSPKNINDYSPQQVDIRDYSSINSNPPRDQELKQYFTQNYTAEDKGYKLPPLVASSNTTSNASNGQNMAHISDKFNSQKNVSHNIYAKDESLEQIQSQHEDTAFNPSQHYEHSKQPREFQNSQQQTIKSYKYSVVSSRKSPSVNISQTVESIEESSSRMYRPPLNKKRSSSRKKESSLARTKFQKDSILHKPPPSQSHMNSMLNDDTDLVVGGEPLKFDSNVYDSEYEQSVNQKELQKRIEQLQAEQKMKISEPQITVNAPVITSQKSNLYSNESSKASGMGGGKLKSLQQARNLAKECKKKSTTTQQNEQILKYEQKMSQLESFLTKREDSVIRETKETKSIKLAIQKSPHPKKNIMNLLDDLQNESSYKQDFESYRDQSEYAK